MSLVMCYFVLCFTLFANSISSLEQSGMERYDANKTLRTALSPFANCLNVILNGGIGSFNLWKENCTVWDISIGASNENSVFHLKISTYLEAHLKSSREKEIFYSDGGCLSIKIYEAYQKEDILLAGLECETVNENNTSTNRSYLSQTSRVRIHVDMAEVKMDYKLEIFYEEIEYSMMEMKYSTDSRQIEPQKTFEGTYRPNTVHYCLLKDISTTNYRSTLITLYQPFIDTSMGEYLLIGAGKEFFDGPQPLFISQPQPDSIYYVDDTNVYVIFMSVSSNVNRTVKFRWEHIGLKTVSDDTTSGNPMDALKSREICFFNTLASEISEPQEIELFQEFRQKFAAYARKYAEEHLNFNQNFETLNASSVMLYQAENKEGSSVLLAMVQVEYEGEVLFTWRQLGEIITNFQVDSSSILGYTVGHCPSYQVGTWNFLMFLSVPAFGVFYLIIWAWKQKIFTQNCIHQKKDNFSKKVTNQMYNVEPNVYEQAYEQAHTIPKVVEINDQGRHQTLVPGISKQENVEENTNEINMNNTNIFPSTSDESVIMESLNNPVSKCHSTIQHLIQENKEENSSLHELVIRKNESEHLYDTVSCEISTDETKL